jgi:hypothetical protein
MSPAQIEDKFLDCAAQAVAPDAAKKILATLRTLGEQESFAQLAAAWAGLNRTFVSRASVARPGTQGQASKTDGWNQNAGPAISQGRRLYSINRRRGQLS